MFKSLSIPVTESSQVGEARRMAHKLGQQAGLNETSLGNLGIVVTELGTNLHKHAKQGELILRRLQGKTGAGVEVLSLDRGPGITEVAKCMTDGYSTSGTTGNGLGSIKRLSTVFDIYSSTQGTALVSQLWIAPGPGPADFETGAVCLPYPGEHLCGDAWTSAQTDNSCTLIVADGLGHGVHAAQAADQAIEVFQDNASLSPQLCLQKIHAALRSTRGAAVVILQAANQKIVYSGIGNVSGGILGADTSKSFVSLNGTIGHQAQRFQEFSYDWPRASLVFFHSDGLHSKWKLSQYPGLQMRHPSLVAGILYRDFRRERDDVTVVILRHGSKTGPT